jgi:hypothetical protein
MQNTNNGDWKAPSGVGVKRNTCYKPTMGWVAEFTGNTKCISLITNMFNGRIFTKAGTHFLFNYELKIKNTKPLDI